METRSHIALRSDAWTPLVEGERARAAIAVARDIASAVQSFVEGGFPSHSEEPPSPDVQAREVASLARGATGIALMYDYLDRAFPDEGYGEWAGRFAGRAMDVVATVPTTPWLFGGVVGVAWLLEHLQSAEAATDEESIAEIDRLVVTHLDKERWTGRYDLISGLVGYAVFALERLPRPVARQCLERILAHLDALAVETDVGITWHTPPHLLPPSRLRTAPEGGVDLGVAHGVAGVIGVLGAMIGNDVDTPRARRLFDGAIAWLHAQPSPAVPSYRFGSFNPEGGTPAPGRMAWCYGDPGMAVALAAAARAAGSPEEETRAMELARMASACPAERTGVVDGGLCHGAAGLMHLYHRASKATGDVALADAARAWLDRTLDMRRPDVGAGGYPSFEHDWIACPGFLCGSSGIALALLAAATPVEPKWDRLLLASNRTASLDDAVVEES